MDKVSIIICAYNEAKTIADVIASCLNIQVHDELIVINDGSTDSTGSIISKLQSIHQFKYIVLPENRGKSYAMYTGIREAENNILLFLDADISGLRKVHLTSLVEPLVKGQAEMVLGWPTETFIDHRLNPFKSFTGERVLKKSDIIPVLDKLKDTRFGIETFLNLYYKSQGMRIKAVMLEGLIHPIKYKKTGPVRATFELIGEGREIGTTLLKNYDLIIQIFSNNIRIGSNYFKEKVHF